MSNKVIAVMDKPEDCQHCVWGVCKYSTPLSTKRKGYYCHLKEPKNRNIEDFAYEDEVHLSDCPLTSLEKHDKEVRNKAIEEFVSLLSAKDNIVKYDIDEILSQSRNFDYACDCLRRYIDEIAEQMKEVEGKKPITYSDTNRADCPTCGATVRGISKPFGKYCSHCGQKLDWGEEDE